ncbi:MAG: hypothetical protein WBF81_04760, partial [Thermoplasmata archaeon]
MASPLYRRPPRPPGIYRAARALRRASVVALVLVLVYVGIVAYSAVQIVRSAPRVGPVTTAFESNGTIGITTAFLLSNPGFFSIQQFALHFRILNGSGDLVVASTVGPKPIAASSQQSLPVALFLPLAGQGASLLTQNQYLDWEVWGNASYGYLFTVSVNVSTERSWGAPFANLSVSVGAPMMVGGMEMVPVTLSFSNDATFADTGDLNVE